MSTTTTRTAKGTVYITKGDADGWLAENAAAEVRVSVADENEIAVSVTLAGNEADDVSVYLTAGEAARLAHMLGAAVLDA